MEPAVTHGRNSRLGDNPKRELLRAVLAVAILVLVAIGFWEVKIIISAPHRVGVQTVDLYQLFLPWYTYVAASLRNMSLPLWLPNIGAGVPFIANPQTAVLYPPNLLFMVLPPGLSMGVLAQCHLILAGLGMYGFCRLHNLGRLASLLAGISYILSYSLWGNYVNHYLAAASWLSVVFYFGERLYEQPTLRNSILLTLAISLQFLSGAPQLFLYTVYFVMLYLALRLIFSPANDAPARKRVHVPIYFSLGMLLVTLICSAQLLPFLEMLKLSVRASNVSVSFVHFSDWRFPWWWPFTNLLYSKSNSFFENVFHQGGLLQVFLVMCALTRYRDRKLYVMGILLVASVLLSTGYSTPLYKYFALLPGIGQSRQPNHLSVLTSFCFTFLAAVGFDECVNVRVDDIRERVRLLRKVITIGIVLGILLWLVHTHGNVLCLTIGVGALIVALLTSRRHILLVAELLILCATVWELGIQYKVTSSHPQAMPDYIGPGEMDVLARVHKTVRNERIFVEERGVPPRPFPTYRVAAEGLNSVTDYHPAISSRMEDIIEAITGVKPAIPDGHIELKPQAAKPDIFNLLSVRYFLVHQKDNIFESAEPDSAMARFAAHLRVIGSNSQYILYENNDALPRAYIVHAALVAENRFDSLRDTLSESLVPRSEVVLEKEEGRDILPLLAPGVGNLPETVKILSYSPNQVSVDVSSEKGGIVILTDSYYPGWVATVDGNSTLIYRANYLFRAVYVPAGEHTVQFFYKPANFTMGALLSIVGVAIAILGLAYSFWGKPAL